MNETTKQDNRGFSLVEVVVAMIILTVGVLGLAASAGAISRLSSEGVRSSGAAMVAGSRLELLRATACPLLANGSATTGAYTEAWRIVTPADAPFARTVTLVVSYPYGRGTRSSTYITEISCAAPSA